VGVSICDIATGMYAYEAILEALLIRARTGRGAVIDVSMFDAMADFLAVPLLQYDYGGKVADRLGLRHATIAPYGLFVTRDGVHILIGIQNVREWSAFCRHFLGAEGMASDPRFHSNEARVANRALLEERIGAAFASLSRAEAIARLERAETAFASLNDMAALSKHPHLRRTACDMASGPIWMPAPPAIWRDADCALGPVPGIGQHSAEIRREFASR
jgi:crotonobetainyl-CoA:carnitine CoA-transferase CaiB-like acyl-CoA transferase